MRSLVISIFLSACKSWTLTEELEKRSQAFEMEAELRSAVDIAYRFRYLVRYNELK